ncbi:MAG: hypothetical protein JSS32_04880 [Verrucomicrobia bacterium]|nr:hypothetical protein [Verrucomicrobiota bacterium]
MVVDGIRILDIEEGKCIPLSEILESIPNPEQYGWALLWFDVNSLTGYGEHLWKFRETGQNGLIVDFGQLIELSCKIFQEIDVLLIGCRNKACLHRYKSDREMYETCDVVIEMIDGGFWEIFGKDTRWIDQLSKKYQRIEFLKSDFQEHLYL